jgi:hypothetical protein
MSAVTLGLTAAQIALIGSAVAATGIGATAYEAHNASIDNSASQANQKALLAQQQQTAANQANLTKQESVLGVQGQEQQQTGGSLTDSGTAALNDLLAGYPGYQAGTAGASATSTGSSGVSSGTTGASTATTAGTGGDASSTVASILAALRGQGGAGSAGPTSSISGGNWQTQPAQPQNQFELANQPV